MIDDDPIVGRAVEKLVRDRHDVTVSDDPVAALARLEAGDRFDVILCDLMMPGLDGVSLYHRVNERDPAQAARMVFMSGGAFTSHAIAFLDAPGRKRMDKPFTRKDLEAAIVLAQGEAAISLNATRTIRADPRIRALLAPTAP